MTGPSFRSPRTSTDSWGNIGPMLEELTVGDGGSVDVQGRGGTLVRLEIRPVTSRRCAESPAELDRRRGSRLRRDRDGAAGGRRGGGRGRRRGHRAGGAR